MALLARQQAKVNGTVLAFTAATATTGDTVAPGDGAVLVRNGGGAAITVTVVTPGVDKYGLARPDIVTGSIAAAGEALVGPFPADLADPSTGLVTLICSAVTTVTLAHVGI